jgi:hypothetical protein
MKHCIDIQSSDESDININSCDSHDVHPSIDAHPDSFDYGKCNFAKNRCIINACCCSEKSLR